MNVYFGIIILFILVTSIIFLIIIGYIIYGVVKKYFNKKTANYSIIFYVLAIVYISINLFYEWFDLFYYEISYPDRHKGKKTVWNYENKHSYNRQYFQPNGEDSAPTNRIITLDKISNQLRFDDIDD